MTVRQIVTVRRTMETRVDRLTGELISSDVTYQVVGPDGDELEGQQRRNAIREHLLRND